MKTFADKLKNHIYWLKISFGFCDRIDETFLKIAYKRKFGRKLNWRIDEYRESEVIGKDGSR